MNIIIHNKEYYVVNEVEDVQALLDANVITQEEADMWFQGLHIEAQNNVNLTLEVRNDRNNRDK